MIRHRECIEQNPQCLIGSLSVMQTVQVESAASPYSCMLRLHARCVSPTSSTSQFDLLTIT